MADRIEKVYDQVRQELMKVGDKGSRELFEMAKQIDKAIGRQSLQQFHARYVLPVKREQAKARGGSRRPRKAKAKAATTTTAAKTGSTQSSRRSKTTANETQRDQVRGVLLKFAQDFAAAETKSDVVRVMSRVDEYIDDISKSFG